MKWHLKLASKCGMSLPDFKTSCVIMSTPDALDLFVSEIQKRALNTYRKQMHRDSKNSPLVRRKE